MNETLSPKRRCQRSGRAPSQDRWNFKYMKRIQVSDPHFSLAVQDTRAVNYGFRRLPHCLHSEQEGMDPQPSHFSENPDNLLYASEGLEQGCQTRAEQPEAPFCFSSSPLGKDGHLGEVTSAATAHLSTPWWEDMRNYSTLKRG